MPEEHKQLLQAIREIVKEELKPVKEDTNFLKQAVLENGRDTKKILAKIEIIEQTNKLQELRISRLEEAVL